LAVIRHQVIGCDGGNFLLRRNEIRQQQKGTNVKQKTTTLLIGSSNGRRFDGKVGRTLVHCVCAREFQRISVLSVKVVRPNDATKGGTNPRDESDSHVPVHSGGKYPHHNDSRQVDGMIPKEKGFHTDQTIK
jgi:hypothetical protein